MFVNLPKGSVIYPFVYSGKTTPLSGAEDSDLHIDTITADLVALLASVFSDPETAPTLILVGHSMGGAACVKACPILQEKKYSVGGVAVLDVVEGEHRFTREFMVLT
jgi:protein phosphatase methylesterase 1